MSGLDGVVGDARKRIEPSWVGDREPMYRPMPHVGNHGKHDFIASSNTPPNGVVHDITLTPAIGRD